MLSRRAVITARHAAEVCGACAALATTSGCAMMMHMRPAADSYTYDVGLATAPDVRTRTSEIFARFGYRVVKDDPSRMFMESQWQQRQPVDEQEQTRGYEIISRVTLTGAPMELTGRPGTYRVLLTVESRYMPLRGTTRKTRDLSSAGSYARSIVEQMSVAFGGNSRPVANELPPF